MTTPFLSRSHPALLEHDTHRFIIDASDLGLPVGRFPANIDTDMGNGLALVAERRDAQDGVVYRQSLGCITLTIAND